jgi:hypothetical protein
MNWHSQANIRLLTTLTNQILCHTRMHPYICPVVSLYQVKNIKSIMKKLKLILTLGLFAGITMLATSCGGNNEEAEKARLDSLRADSTMKADREKAMADSIAQAAALDSLNRIADSLAAAADAANAKAAAAGKGGKAKTPTVVKIENPKVNTTTATTTTTTTGPTGVKGSAGSTTSGGPTGVKGSGTQGGSTGPTGVKGK